MEPRELLTPPMPGVYDDAAMEHYLGWDAVSASLLKDVTRSISWAEWRRRHDSGDTRYTVRGTALHAALLEPEAFESRYRPLPEGCDLRTNEGKRAKAKIELRGRIALPAADYDAARYVRDRCQRHEQVRSLLELGKPEVSCVWEDEDTGLVCKSRPDVLAEPARTIVDLKTSTDVSPARFARHSANMGYHRSVPHYLAGARALELDVRHWLMLAVEAEPPYDVCLYAMDPRLVEHAAELNRRAMRAWAHARATETYTAYPAGVVPLLAPGWAFRED